MLVFTQPMLDSMQQHFLPLHYMSGAKSDLYEMYPQHLTALGPGTFHQLVEFGVEKAWRYGYRQDVSIRQFLMLMVHLGCDMDHDPLLPWLTCEFSPQGNVQEKAHMSSLWARYCEYVASTVGDNREIFARALTRFTKLSYDTLQQCESVNDQLQLLQVLYPERIDPWLESSDISTFIEYHCAKRVMQYKWGSAPAMPALYGSVAFLLGGYWDEDLMHSELQLRLETHAGTADGKVIYEVVQGYMRLLLDAIQSGKWLA